MAKACEHIEVEVGGFDGLGVEDARPGPCRIGGEQRERAGGLRACGVSVVHRCRISLNGTGALPRKRFPRVRPCGRGLMRRAAAGPGACPKVLLTGLPRPESDNNTAFLVTVAVAGVV